MITLELDRPDVSFWQDGTTYHLDVRALLEAGGEPYEIIMSCVQQIESGDTLMLHALFEPKPLIRQVRGMGLQPRCERVGVDHWVLAISRA